MRVPSPAPPGLRSPRGAHSRAGAQREAVAGARLLSPAPPETFAVVVAGATRGEQREGKRREGGRGLVAARVAPRLPALAGRSSRRPALRTWPAVSARSLHYLGVFIVVLAKLILPSGRTAVPSSFTLCDDATSRPRQSSQSWLVDLGASPPLLSFLSSMHI